MPDGRAAILSEPQSRQAEAFRVLRIRLAALGDPRLVAVTSALADEGAIECAANLAVALAERHKSRVLVVDTSPGEWKLARLIGAPLSTAGEGTRGAGQRLEIQSTPLPQPMWLDFGGILRAGPDAPLDGISLTANLRDLQRIAYDYIVIAAPPVLDSSDANFVADGVDAVLMAARAGRSSARKLRRAVERLAPREILGVALLDA